MAMPVPHVDQYEGPRALLAGTDAMEEEAVMERRFLGADDGHLTPSQQHRRRREKVMKAVERRCEEEMKKRHDQDDGGDASSQQPAGPAHPKDFTGVRGSAAAK